MKQQNVLDILINNIKTDQQLLKDAETKIDEAKQEKQDVASRLKDYRTEIGIMQKYATEEQLKHIEELGFNSNTGSKHELNQVAKIAFDIVMKAKDYKLTNLELYNAYVATFKNKDEAVNYTAFNIKCRSLFNSQRLLRAKGAEGTSSKEDVISLNGRPVKKDEPAKEQKTEKPSK